MPSAGWKSAAARLYTPRVGILENSVTHESHSLAPRSLVGRAHASALPVSDPRVSAEHALVFWSGAAWEVRDLGSSNGTTLDGRKLSPGERAAMKEGSELRFAGGDRWALIDASPPIASARSTSGDVRSAEGGLLVLPGPESPIASVYEDGEGAWWIEIGDEARPAADREVVIAGGEWRLSIPKPAVGDHVPTTIKLDGALDLATATLRFGVSRDEEHVELSIVRDGASSPPSARAHNYALLTLARARLRDREGGKIPASEQGWLYVDDLLRMLRTDAEKLNLDIFRARQHLSQLGVSNAGALVQRRSTSRQIRLGTSRVEIAHIGDAVT